MMKKIKIHALCAWLLLALTACSSDSTDGDINYLAGHQLVAEIAPGINMFFLDHGDGTVSVTYDHRNPMHVNKFNKPEITDYVGDIVIPETVVINGYTYRVVGITEYAFMNNTLLTSVKSPATVKNMGRMAFFHCTTLQRVNIPDGMTEVPEECFSGLTTLTTVDMPSRLTKIGKNAFKGCSKLETIVIPQGITALNDSLFYGCTNLEKVTLPEGLTAIGVDCFHGVACQNIPLPSTLKTLSKFAFNSSKINFVEVPASVTTLTDSVFCKCTSLKKVILPETLTKLGIGTFAGCRSLTEIDLPASVVEIGKDCFSSLDSKTGESNWKKITVVIKATTPPVLGGSIVNATERRDLIVPRGSRAAYEQAEYWNEFTKIFERNF